MGFWLTFHYNLLIVSPNHGVAVFVFVMQRIRLQTTFDKNESASPKSPGATLHRAIY